MEIENNTNSVSGGFTKPLWKKVLYSFFKSLQWQLHNLTSTFIGFNNAITLRLPGLSIDRMTDLV